MNDIGSTRVIFTKKGFTAMFRLVGAKQRFVEKDGKRVYYPTIEQAATGAGLALKTAHDARQEGRKRAQAKAAG